MRARLLSVVALFVPAMALMAAANGAWLKRVPEADRARVNPYAGQPAAAEAGRLVYENNCAKCHGEHGEGKHGRPALTSDRVAHATDGELAWILKNGAPFQGMPSWSALPEPQRWQVVTWLRTLPSTLAAGKSGDR